MTSRSTIRTPRAGKYRMRAYEIVGLNEGYLTEEMLIEGFVDSLARAVGNKVQEQITVVNNTATAMVVLYKAVSNPQYLETITFLLKKQIKTNLKQFPDGPFKQAIVKVFPQGRGLKDFLKALLLEATVKGVMKAGKLAKAEALDQIKDQVLNLESLLGLAANGVGIFQVLKALGIANEVLFEMLTYLNTKIMTAPVQPNGAPQVPVAAAGLSLTKAG